MRAFLEQRSSPSSPAHTDLEDSPNVCGWRAGLFNSTVGCALKHHIALLIHNQQKKAVAGSLPELLPSHSSINLLQKKLNYTSRFLRVIFAQKLANISASFLCQCNKTASNLRRLHGGQTVLCFFSSVLLTTKLDLSWKEEVQA